MTVQKIYFKGHFQCRLATDPDPHAATDGTSGHTFAYGEAPFDRIIRFSNPVALRSYLYFTFSSVKVTSVDATGLTGTDSIIGQVVNLGPSTYFAGESDGPGLEPLANFQFKIGTNSFYAEATVAPKGQGVALVTAAEKAKYGINPAQIYNDKKTQMTSAYNAMPDKTTTAAVNLKKRLDDLVGPLRGFRFGIDQTSPGEVEFIVIYPGVLNKSITVNAGSSDVLDAIKSKTQFDLLIKFVGYDSDGLVGQVDGELTPK